MKSAADRATIDCVIYQSPAVSGGKVGVQTLLLSGRKITPFYPLSDPAQVAMFDSYRDVKQAMIFASSDSDWASLQGVSEGMTLLVNSQKWVIRRCDQYQRDTLSNGTHDFLHLFVERAKVAV